MKRMMKEKKKKKKKKPKKTKSFFDSEGFLKAMMKIIFLILMMISM